MIFNTTGGGAALNFKVLAYATEEALLAATPAENTIGIITETPITSWIFSATEPSPAAAGMVWITIGTSSPVEFNALKKNGLQVYPISAKQYVGGAWVDVTAKSYRGGAWVDWWNGELFYDGNQFESVTGGWVAKGIKTNTYYAAETPSLQFSNGKMIMSIGSGKSGIVYCNNMLDTSEYDTLQVVFDSVGGGTNQIRYYNRIPSDIDELLAYTDANVGTVNSPLPATNPKYIAFSLQNGASMTVSKVKMI